MCDGTKINYANKPKNSDFVFIISDISIVTSGFLNVQKDIYNTLNYRPYTEGCIWYNYNGTVLRQDIDGCMVYLLNYHGKQLSIKNPNRIGKLYILDNHKHLNDIKHSRGNVIIGRNYYAIDTSDITREVTIINRD